jgi:hypothetical protein
MNKGKPIYSFCGTRRLWGSYEWTEAHKGGAEFLGTFIVFIGTI